MIEVYRFWPKGLYKAVCATCYSLVAKSDVNAHARWHHYLPGLHKTGWGSIDGAHLDVTLTMCNGAIQAITNTGWVTNETGPG